MPKKIKNPIQTIIVKEDGECKSNVVYGVICDDCGQETRPRLEITLKPQTLSDVNEEVMEQIHAHEGTTEMYVEPEEPE